MEIVELRNITKTYGSVKALDGVDLTIKKGQIHALLGENGAGKSTLMNVLYGMVKNDSGDIYINGQKNIFNTPSHAINKGIGMVHQHFMLVPVMTVLENIIAGAEPKKGSFIDYVKAKKEISEMIKELGLDIELEKLVEDLSVGQKQRVEIMKVLYKGADILILDEPTAVLTPLEVEKLFGILRKLKNQGRSIIIITHKLYEVMEISDEITVMRDGKITGNTKSNQTDSKELAIMMFGRDIDIGLRRPSKHVGDTIFEVSSLNLKDKDHIILDNINFNIHSGEILGVVGVEGNGQTELVETITKIRQPDSINIMLNGEPIDGNVNFLISKGIGHIPGDRHKNAIVSDMNISENIILGYHRDPFFCKNGLLNKKRITDYALESIEEYGIKAQNPEMLLGNLSGGNQQKVVIARIFKQTPQVVIAAHPTRGVDVSAIEYIHNRMVEFRENGNAILLISADLQEIRALSDRIVVMYKGKIVAEGKLEDYNDIELGILMTGGKLTEKGSE